MMKCSANRRRRGEYEVRGIKLEHEKKRTKFIALLWVDTFALHGYYNHYTISLKFVIDRSFSFPNHVVRPFLAHDG